MIQIEQPLVILAPSRTFNTALCATLAQHPELYGFPETQLFTRPTMAAWLEDFGSNIQAHGLLRTTAELVFGTQSPAAVNQARRWLVKRSDSSTATIFHELASTVYPRAPIDCTPMVVSRTEHMQRVLEALPQARFLHVTRHPISYGDSLLRLFKSSAPMRHPNQLAALLHNPESAFFGLADESMDLGALDPLRCWYMRHASIVSFTSALPERSRLQIRIEQFLQQPTATLSLICSWLGAKQDAETIAAMLYPQRWPFACVGPWNARLGGDLDFLRTPVLPLLPAEDASLDDPLPWREDAGQLDARVSSLAQELGYS